MEDLKRQQEDYQELEQVECLELVEDKDKPLLEVELEEEQEEVQLVEVCHKVCQLLECQQVWVVWDNHQWEEVSSKEAKEVKDNKVVEECHQECLLLVCQQVWEWVECHQEWVVKVVQVVKVNQPKKQTKKLIIVPLTT